MIRATLGASRLRLMARILLEIILVSLLGGALGVLIARWSIDFIKWGSPVYLYAFQKVEFNPAALLFVLGITTLVALLSGLPPAFNLSDLKLGLALRDEGGRSGTATSPKFTPTRRAPRAPEPAYNCGHSITLPRVCRGLREQRIAGTRSLPALGPAAAHARQDKSRLIKLPVFERGWFDRNGVVTAKVKEMLKPVLVRGSGN